MALRGFVPVVERVRRVHEVREEVGEDLLQPPPAVVREYVRYCADVSAMAGE
jgi:hypothetical protein